jgi:BirA family biotin operon repressor/biotin-[acetyl-CoA-carboxylase] ligase
VLPSTSDRALAAADEPGPLPLLVVADRQLAGRGRGGNRWWSGPGALTFSLLLDAPALGIDPRRHAPLLSLAGGMAVVDAVDPLISGLASGKPADRQLGLHWPNDVFCDRRKLAGILIECPRPDRVVVGIGINVNDSASDAPPALRDRLTTLGDLTGREHDRGVLLGGVLDRLASRLAQIAHSPVGLTSAANDRCLQRGRSLTVFDAGMANVRDSGSPGQHDPITGRCLGIGEEGALLLKTDAGERRIISGTLDQS